MSESNDDEKLVKIEKPRSCWATTGLFIIAAGMVVVMSRDFLMPIVLAFLLSLTFSPVRRVLSRRGVSDELSAALITVSLILIIIVAMLGLSQPVRQYAGDAKQIMRQVEWKLRDVNEVIEKVAEASETVEELAKGKDKKDPDEPQKVVVEQSSLVKSIAFGTPYFAAQLGLTLVLLFFLIASGDMFYEKIVQVSATFRDKRRSVEIMKEIERKLSRYFLTITIINAGLGVAVAIVLAALGMPNPVVFGVMAFLFNYVPFIGAIAGVAIAFAIGIVSLDSLWSAGVVALAYLGLTTIEGQFVTPYAVGRNLKLNPVIVFVSVAFWGWAWSVIGMFIAVPLLLLVKTIADAIPSLNGLGIFLSGRDVSAPVEERKGKAD